MLKIILGIPILHIKSTSFKESNRFYNYAKIDFFKNCSSTSKYRWFDKAFLYVAFKQKKKKKKNIIILSIFNSHSKILTKFKFWLVVSTKYLATDSNNSVEKVHLLYFFLFIIPWYNLLKNPGNLW